MYITTVYTMHVLVRGTYVLVPVWSISYSYLLVAGLVRSPTIPEATNWIGPDLVLQYDQVRVRGIKYLVCAYMYYVHIVATP